MKGEEALAAALLAATDRRYAVPGYPVTELAALCGAETVVNEKTGLEYALGDSLSGRRAALVVKNVGVNACVDPLVQATAQGLRAGVLLVCGDDPEARGSQTSQDTRIVGELAEIPVLEPGPETCFSAVEAALEASEEFSRVAMLRVTPALLGAEVTGAPIPRAERQGRLSDRSYTMHGRMAASRRLFSRMRQWADRSPLNAWRGGVAGVGPAPGETRIVTVFPPPARLAGYSVINEEGLPFAADHCGHRFLPGTPEEEPETIESRGFYRTFCRDCPFKPVISLMREEGMRPVVDAGCAVLAMNPPYRIGVASYGMGSSVAVAARSTAVALTGDYALLHSGLNALIDVYEKGLPLLCVVLDNRCAAMTGRQPAIPLEPYIGWANPRFVEARDTGRIRELFRTAERPAVIVVRGECPGGQEHEIVECRDM
ncbi:MAG: thiamine pyrophosphate-dependent enzyme [Methanolinea sp.]|nr:thiamine pyrophosphate-dependent enzyme [Methanolinea sp.]